MKIAMNNSFAQYKRIQAILAQVAPDWKFDKREFNRENAEKLVCLCVFLLDALFKGENIMRKKNLQLPAGRDHFSADPLALMENINLYLNAFHTQVLSFSRNERQTFTFIIENLIDYLRGIASQDDEKEKKKAFLDNRFWIENFFKAIDQKFTGAIVANRKAVIRNLFASEPPFHQELIFTHSLASFSLFPFLVLQDGRGLFLCGAAGGGELAFRELVTMAETRLRSEDAVARLAEFALANFAFPLLESLPPRQAVDAAHSPLGHWEAIQQAFRKQRESLFSESAAIVNEIPFEDFNLPLLYLLQVRNLLQLNRPFECKRLLQKFLLFYPHYADGYEILGDLYAKEENADLAVSFYEKALTIAQNRGAGEKLKHLREAAERNKAKPEAVRSDLYMDLTEMSLQAEEKIVPREKELRQVIEILISDTRRNVLLVGDRGVGKSTLIRALAQKIVCGEVPDALKEKRVKEINFVALLTGSKYRGQFEEKVLKFFQEFKSQNAILVLEDIHLMMASGAARGTSLDLVNILKQFLRENSIQIIATTDYEEFKNTLEKDNSFMGHLQRIIVNEMSAEETRRILAHLAEETLTRENVRVSPAVIDAVVENAKRSIRERRLPDSAVMVLERAVAKVKLRRGVAGGNGMEIQDSDVAEVLADILNLPETAVSVSLKSRLLGLKENLRQRLIGQDEALERMVSSIVTAKLELSVKKNRPGGVFLFIGPTGVGKTETAIALSESLYGSQDYLIRIDMSEYMEKFTYSRFIGAAPGYVGYYDANQLTDKVRQNPFSIILLDEVEKADSQLLNIFLQVFDAGRLTDARGNVVDFSKTIIIMTSNIGTALFSKAHMGYQGNLDSSDVSRLSLIKSLKRYFSPEFLNRIDEIIVFNHLAHDDVRQIIRLQLQEVRRELERQGKELAVRDEVVDFIAREGYSVEYGARNIARVLKKELLEKIAHISLDKEWECSRSVVCRLRDGAVEVSLERLGAAVGGERLFEGEEGR